MSCSNRWHYSNGFKLGFQKGHGNFDGAEKGWFTTERVSGENNVNWKSGKFNGTRSGVGGGFKTGIDNCKWKEENVGYKSLHEWVRRHKDGAGICEECGEEKFTDVANISREYERDVNDYKWLCKSCHKKYDFDFDNIKRDGLGRFTSESFQK